MSQAPCPQDCVAHSGFGAKIAQLEKFRENQEGKDGVNQRVWETLAKINQKQNWILGGVSFLGFAMMVGTAIIGLIWKK